MANKNKRENKGRWRAVGLSHREMPVAAPPTACSSAELIFDSETGGPCTPLLSPITMAYLRFDEPKLILRAYKLQHHGEKNLVICREKSSIYTYISIPVLVGPIN